MDSEIVPKINGREKKWYIAYSLPSVLLRSIADHLRLCPALWTRGSNDFFNSEASVLYLSSVVTRSFSSNPSELTYSMKSVVRLSQVLIFTGTLAFTLARLRWSKLLSKNELSSAKRLSLLNSNVRICTLLCYPVPPAPSAVSPKGKRQEYAPEITSGFFSWSLRSSQRI